MKILTDYFIHFFFPFLPHLTTSQPYCLLEIQVDSMYVEMTRPVQPDPFLCSGGPAHWVRSAVPSHIEATWSFIIPACTLLALTLTHISIVTEFYILITTL